MTRMRVRPQPTGPPPVIGALDFEYFTGLPVPDPITFAIGPQWLNRRLYPRQATAIKIVFLRVDLLTDYDLEVIAEWEQAFLDSGDRGIVPGIVNRMIYLRALGHRWFKEFLLVMGRRAGKGYLSALCMAYILWCYLAKGDPQEFYQIDRDKKLDILIYAGKKEQARDNLWRDLVNVIIGGPCFAPYVNRPLGETLTVYAPADKIKMAKLFARGINASTLDLATFRIMPKEATLMSGRGGASFMIGFDEFAHVTSSLAKASSESLYASSTPSLDQFKKDAFIIQPSSPWTMTGQFYINWQQCQMFDPATGDPLYPSKAFLQLESWAIYEDWERAHQIPLFPIDFGGDLGEYFEEAHPELAELRLAIQEFDDEMIRLEQASPDVFAVERRSKWQATLNAYLDPKKIRAMWVLDRKMSKQGALNRTYAAHADPSLVNDNFGLAVAHTEPHEDGFERVVFDWIQHWEPQSFEDNTIDYTLIEEELWEVATSFPLSNLTFDQFNSAHLIARLNLRLRTHRSHKPINIGLETATAPHNLKVAESFKIALNQGWISSPYYEQADLELRFLKFENGKVTHQDTGPVIHDDVARCMMEVTHYLIGTQIQRYLTGGHVPLSGAMQGGTGSPLPGSNSEHDNAVFGQFEALSQQRKMAAQFARNGFSPARGRPDFTKGPGGTGYRR